MGAISGPSWEQFSSKNVGGLCVFSIFAVSRRASFQEPFREDFGPHLGSKLGSKSLPRGVPKRCPKRSKKRIRKYSQNGPTWAPGPPPRGAQDEPDFAWNMGSVSDFVGRCARTPPGPLRDPLLGWILVPGAPSRSPRGPPNRRFGSHFGSPNRCFWSLSRFELPSQIGPHLALFSKADRGPQGVLRRCSAQRAQFPTISLPQATVLWQVYVHVFLALRVQMCFPYVNE